MRISSQFFYMERNVALGKQQLKASRTELATSFHEMTSIIIILLTQLAKFFWARLADIGSSALAGSTMYPDTKVQIQLSYTEFGSTGNRSFCS